MATPDQNIFAVRGRADKCWRFARWAISKGLTFEDLAEWEDWQWDMAADELGVKSPSERSRGQIIGYLTPNDLWSAPRTARS